MTLRIKEDNQATIKILQKEYSTKLRNVNRTHKVDLGSVKEVLDQDNVVLEYVTIDKQCADLFTKALAPAKRPAPLDMLGIDQIASNVNDSRTECAIAPLLSVTLTPPLKGALACCAIADDAVANVERHCGFEQANHLLTTISKHVGLAAATPPTAKPRPSGKSNGWGTVIEICASEASNIGTVGAEFDNVEVIRITKDMDFKNPETIAQIKSLIRACPGASVHGSLPCTVWSTWQTMAIHNLGQQYETELNKRRQTSLSMLKSFIELAELAMSLGGHASFEWPRHCTGWLQPPLLDFIHRNQLHNAEVDGCACGMTTSKGEPILKQCRFVTSSARQAHS